MTEHAEQNVPESKAPFISARALIICVVFGVLIALRQPHNPSSHEQLMSQMIGSVAAMLAVFVIVRGAFQIAAKLMKRRTAEK